MKLPINLATKPAETHRLFFVVTGLLIGLSGTLSLGLALHVRGIRKLDVASQMRKDQMDREITALAEQRENLVRYFARPENAKLHERASLINTIIDEQSFNWTGMFMDLEHILPGGARVINIEPRRANGQAIVKLTIGAVNEQSKNDFLQALERSNSFSQVALSSIHTAEQNAAEDHLILELTLAYSGAS